jgi:hypothetical protein
MERDKTYGHKVVQLLFELFEGRFPGFRVLDDLCLAGQKRLQIGLRTTSYHDLEVNLGNSSIV